MYIPFQLKKHKMNAKGLVPINMRMILDYKRIEFSAHRYVSPDNQDDKANRAKETSNDSIILNNWRFAHTNELLGATRGFKKVTNQLKVKLEAL